MSDQTEALRLADLWEKHSHGYARTPEARTAALLRRQHAEIEAIKAERDEDRRREYGYSQQTVDALKKECEALRADAERYRWLRSDVATAENYPIACMRVGGWLLLGDELDAAIDAAREGDRDE